MHYKRHPALNISQYLQFHEEDTPRNSQADRKKDAIFLGPSGINKVGFKFMSLHSAKKITRRIWYAIPMPETVIA